MPYIVNSRRLELVTDIVRTVVPLNKGELNYLISLLMHNYVKRAGLSYQNLSDAKGAAQDAAEEFSRTVMGPYEDRKRLENGSVSELDKVKNDKRTH